MKKTSIKKLSRKIEREYAVAIRFCKLDTGAYYTMMIDTDDADVWSDTFISSNDWREYRSPTIYKLETAYSAEEYLDEAIELLQEAGWEFTD
ncbi:hypothetical protein [Diplocloster modestus]|uniref:Uncharacterized protein n=1 Tax=Diplocloster modestus TaxID=2850322 RepID=A0ABS6K0Y5_9FIRM|nr:hypothetical protein [Diplocloster modestus]MBU9724505.1 hypothetical protein [Diplocloster modestus]